VPTESWDTDDPRDLDLIQRNVASLLASLRTSAPSRLFPDVADVCSWHAQLYAGCRVPTPGYVGHLRGDPEVPELRDYEVGVGRVQPDGFPEKVGVLSFRVASEVEAVLSGLHAVLGRLDERFPPGNRPRTAADLHAVVQASALAHGEWIRVHPFANGNGRTGRIWVAFLCLRYGLPVFVHVKPRPEAIAYARAAWESMGRPPLFVGDHTATEAVFAAMLAESLA
jgi:hypothetical protein